MIFLKTIFSFQECHVFTKFVVFFTLMIAWLWIDCSLQESDMIWQTAASFNINQLEDRVFIGNGGSQVNFAGQYLLYYWLLIFNEEHLLIYFFITVNHYFISLNKKTKPVSEKKYIYRVFNMDWGHFKELMWLCFWYQTFFPLCFS